MANQINSGSIDTLNQNETLLTRILTTSTDKIQLEFVEQIQNPHAAGSNSGINLLYLANKSDVRFSRRGGQYAWLTGTPEDVLPLFGITDIKETDWVPDPKKEGRNMIELNILNPEVMGQASPDGEPIRARVQVIESVEPNEWQAEDINSRCKTRGKDGDPIMHQGKHIFVQRTVMPCAGDTPAESNFLKPDPVNAKATDPLAAFNDVKGLEL